MSVRRFPQCVVGLGGVRQQVENLLGIRAGKLDEPFAFNDLVGGPDCGLDDKVADRHAAPSGGFFDLGA